MGSLQCTAERCNEEPRGFEVERTLDKPLCERRPFDVLDDEIHQAVVFDSKVDRTHDRRMIERPEDRSLSTKPSSHRVVGDVLGAKQLDGNTGAVAEIDGDEDIAHASLGERRDQLVAARNPPTDLAPLAFAHLL